MWTPEYEANMKVKLRGICRLPRYRLYSSAMSSSLSKKEAVGQFLRKHELPKPRFFQSKAESYFLKIEHQTLTGTILKKCPLGCKIILCRRKNCFVLAGSKKCGSDLAQNCRQERDQSLRKLNIKKCQSHFLPRLCGLGKLELILKGVFLLL